MSGVRLVGVARVVALLGLAGMAYCHIRDVGMKFDEGVYYMATLFCCNIAASLGLIALLAWLDRLPPRLHRPLWAGSGALAATTILGFLWSRTVGFPQMADHVGEWDVLGLTSVGFEVLVIAASSLALLHTARAAPSAEPVA